ncbi:MAG: hypothetical protein HY322_02835 [Betaproteobacteria bacterium]|nr:hypothetical protein [Betaproteobacteria bacterium]
MTIRYAVRGSQAILARTEEVHVRRRRARPGSGGCTTTPVRRGARGDQAAASTQNQALAALLFVYKEVLAQPLPWLEGLEHAKRPMHRPTVLTEDEVQHLLARMHGTKWLMGSLLYGAGLRLGEQAAVEVRHVERIFAL